MKIVSRHINGKLAVIVAAAVIGLGGLLLPSLNTVDVKAEEGCTKSGEAKYIGPVHTCDCTITTVNTCACIVPCVPGNN